MLEVLNSEASKGYKNISMRHNNKKGKYELMNRFHHYHHLQN